MYVTLAELKEYADFESDTDDNLLRSMLLNAEQLIDTHTGRTFAASGISSKSLDAIADVDGAYLYLDSDCNEITAIINGDGEVLETSAYVVEPRNITPIFAVKLLGSSNISWTYTDDPENSITVSGYWGFSKEAPYDIKQACLRLTNWLYKQRETSVDIDRPVVTEFGVIMPASLPKDILEILSGYRSVTILG